MFKYPFIGEGTLIIIVATHTIAAINAAITNFLILECIFHYHLYISLIIVYNISDHITITN